VPSSLELVVTSVATRLMGVNAATSVEVSQRVLADLVEYLGVDVSFLRHNDHRMHASILVAEWPVRPGIPDPDPLAVVYFVICELLRMNWEEGVLARAFPSEYPAYAARVPRYAPNPLKVLR